MKKTLQFASVALLLGATSPAVMAEADCLKLAVSVKHAIAASSGSLLEVVEREVAANPSCACDIVKAAIEAVEADAKQVAAIVETAASVAPDQMRLISQCALAVAPDALSEVQMTMARLAPNQGEVAYAGAKSGKAPKMPIEVKPAWNPLDFPGQGIGPNPGSPGGLPILPPGPQTLVPPVVVPPVVPPVIEPPVGTPTDPFRS